jgi:hypothetical protein
MSERRAAVRRPCRPGRRPSAAARWLLGAGLLLLAVGCSGRRVTPPRIAPESAGQQALAAYDSNHDGALDAKELEQCPALRDALKAADRDGDGRLSADEIAARITTYQASRIGLLACACQVTLDGRPLADATVSLVPEKFLGPDVKPASGVSDARGMVVLQTQGAEVPGVACALYRVEVSKKNAAGQETIPARYNTQTVLGLEVAPDTPQRGLIVFALTSY